MGKLLFRAHSSVYVEQRSDFTVQKKKKKKKMIEQKSAKLEFKNISEKILSKNIQKDEKLNSI